MQLVQSTGKLKDLVTSGINEQLAVVKCEEYSNKIKVCLCLLNANIVLNG